MGWQLSYRGSESPAAIPSAISGFGVGDLRRAGGELVVWPAAHGRRGPTKVATKNQQARRGGPHRPGPC